MLDENEALNKNSAEIFFDWGKLLPTTDANFYLDLRLENDVIIEEVEDKIAKNEELIFHIDQFTSIKRLCISPNIAIKVIEIVHSDKHLGFTKCYQIVVRLWYISGLIKSFYTFIKHCP